jgi:transcriptional regulator with XRE-family HTH domain
MTTKATSSDDEGRANRIASGPNFAGSKDSSAETLRIGARLRAARLRQKLSLDQLARTTGLSKGFISQLERDMASASVASLVKLCEAVHISVGSLFQPSQTLLTTAECAPLINFGGSGLSEQLLTPRSSSELQVIRSEVAPGGGSGDEAYVLDAKAEVVHVLAGQLVVTVDDEVFTLDVGDTLSFSPRQAHSWHNPSSRRRAVVLWALAPSPW